MQHCIVCKDRARTLYSCSGCELVLYCGSKCASIDWSDFHHADHAQGEHDANLVLPPSDENQGSVWIGGIAALKDKHGVMRHIDAVVSALHEDQVQQCALDVLIGSSRPHIRVSVWDDPEEADQIALHFDRAADFVHKHVESGRNVLVHCAAGISRSTTLVLYYMLKYRGYKSVDEALEKVRERRPDANPNRGFLRVLE